MITSIDVDTVVLNCYGTYDYRVLDGLAVLREIAKSMDSDYPLTEGFLEGWTIKPYGSSSKGFTYILVRDDVRVYVGKGSGQAAPNMCLQIGSLTCHDHHLPSLVAEIQSDFSFECEREQLSRADLCRDAECDFGLHQSLVSDPRNWYWNSKIKFTPYYDGDRFTGVQLGRSEIVGRLYDKTYEMASKRHSHKVEFFSNYWGLDLSKTTVFRLEFQMRREYFRSVDVQTLEDFFNKKDEIWSYLTKQWCFFSGSPVKRGTGNNSAAGCEIFDLWKLYLSESKPVERKAPKRSIAVSDRVFKQGFGCMMSYAMSQTDTRSLTSLFNEILDYVEEFMNHHLFSAGISGVQNRYERRLQNYRNMNHHHCHEVPF